MKKKTISLLLCIAMILSLLPTVAFADNTHTVNKGTLTNCDLKFSSTSCYEGQLVVVTVIPKAGYKLASPEDNVTAYHINNSTQYTTKLSYTGDNQFDLFMPDGDVTINAYCEPIEQPAPTEIDKVYLSGPAIPEVGSKVSDFFYEIAFSDMAPYYIKDSGVYISGSGERLSYTGSFEAGVEYYYKVIFWPSSGYTFGDATNADLDFLEVGSQSVEFDAEEGKTMFTVVTVPFKPYDPSAPAPTEITSVAVTGVQAPEYGKPCSTAGITASANPAESLSSCSVSWCKKVSVDDTWEYGDADGVWGNVFDEKFEEGTYKLFITVFAKDGYSFSDEFTPKINGEDATLRTPYGNYRTFSSKAFTVEKPIPVTKYDVWVGGVQVTDSNRADVLGDGKVSYVPDTKTLTVKSGANITGTHFDAAIYIDHAAVKTLRLDGAVINTDGRGIWVINSGLDIFADGNVTINSKDSSIAVEGGNVSIAGNGNINLTSTNGIGIFTGSGSVTLTDACNVSITTGSNTSIRAYGNITISTGGNVTIISNDYAGMYARDHIFISGGTVDITAGICALTTDGNISIADTHKIITPENGELGTASMFGNTVLADGEVADHVVIAPPVADAYDVWVNNEQFTKDKLTINCGSGTATFDPEKSELTLLNATITNGYAYGSYSGIYSEHALTVVVKGTNTIELDNEGQMVGVYVYEEEELKLTGSGTLNIVMKDQLHNADLYDAWAVWTYGSLYIENVTINCTSSGLGLCSMHDVNVSGNADLTIKALYEGLHAYDGSLTFSGKAADITATRENPISAKTNITIADGLEIITPENGKIGTSGDRKVVVDAADKAAMHVVIGAKHSHSAVLHLEVPAACTASGVKAYYTCSCGKAFEDSACKNEISNLTAWKAVGGKGYIAPLGHGKTEVRNAKAAACTEAGYTGDTYCTVCGAKISSGKTIAALGHKFGAWSSISDTQHKRVCAADPSHVETAEHSFTGNVCDDCGYVRIVSYTIIAGANGVWTKDSTEGLSFTSDAPFAKFEKVMVDGLMIASSNYTAVAGSTKITLAPAYLNDLNIGMHKIEVVSIDGSASTNFTVREAVAPATGTITISKSFIGIDDDDLPFQAATFTVQSADGTYTRSAKIGDREFGASPSGQWVWTLRGVPAGTYTVTETGFEVDGYTASVSYRIGREDEREGSVATAALGGGDDLVIIFTDAYVKDVTVSFDMNGHGQQVEAQTIQEGEKATAPADPTAEGFTFEGWYADADLTTAFDFDSLIREDTTVYAKWTEVKQDDPTDPTEPIDPTDPTDPVDPTDPTDPVDPTNPTDPTEPTKPTNPDKPADPSSPQTGDNSHLFVWVALLFISGGALVGTVVYDRKRKYGAK